MFSFLSVIASCDDTASEVSEVMPPEPPTVFWEEAHLSMMGWKGTVKAVEESSVLDSDGSEEELISSVEWKFDEVGHLTYYNPIGGVNETSIRNVWQTLFCYSYKYDEKGRLIEVIADDLSGNPIVYKLIYSEHSVYVPLIFPLGTFEFFLVKGLAKIESTDGSISYHFDGKRATYSTESWIGTEVTVYEYEENAVYPARKTVTVTRNQVEISSEITSYLYNTDGSLASSDKLRKEGVIEVERNIIRNVSGTLQPVSKIADAGGMTFDWTYQYDKEMRLAQTSYIENKGLEDESVTDVSYSYPQFDGMGNWTKVIQLQANSVSGVRTDEFTINVYRNISYH